MFVHFGQSSGVITDLKFSDLFRKFHAGPSTLLGGAVHCHLKRYGF